MDKISNERKAQIFYQGNGSQTQYSFPFDYLRKAFVHVSLISDEKIEELTQGKDYTVNDRVVTLAAPTGLKIKICRVTTTKPLVGWADASVLKAADMTVQSTQLLHLAEETSDLAQEGGLSKDATDNIWDARYNKIKNLLDPTEPGDAVTLNYITKNQTSLLTQLRNTGAAQNASIVATGDAQNTRLTATGDKQNTRLTSTGDTQNKRLTDTGNTYVSTMTTLRDTTATKATEANNSADLAKKWAMSATSPDGATNSKSSKTWAEEAKVSAGNAAASASASQSSADSSASYVATASSSANAAKQSALSSANRAAEAASSASNAATSASNAKTSETKAAKSAAAAAQSAIDAAKFDPSSYYTKTETYTRAEVNNKIAAIPKPDMSNYYTKSEVNAKIPTKTSQLTNDSGFITATSVPTVEQSSGVANKNSAYIKGPGNIAWDKYGKIVSLRIQGSITQIYLGSRNQIICTNLPRPKTKVSGNIIVTGSYNIHKEYICVDTYGNLTCGSEDYDDSISLSNPTSIECIYIAE